MKNNPYPHQNFASTEDYLEELILWTSGERGRIPIDENNGGYEDLEVDDTEAKTLTVPEAAVSAAVFFEVDASATNKARALRYKENGTAPTAASGQAFGDGDVLELFGKTSLTNFKVIGIEAEKTHTLRVQYYQTAQA
ncbi:MAG TPA: hypothetical protein VIN73_11820 [Vicingaceae bacterium]